MWSCARWPAWSGRKRSKTAIASCLRQRRPAASSPPGKTFRLAAAVLRWFDAATEALRRGAAFVELPVEHVQHALSGLRDAAGEDAEGASQRVDEVIDALATHRAGSSGEQR